MKIDTSLHGSLLTLTIHGHITGTTEVEEIKAVLSAHKSLDKIELNLLDAFVMPSALIGHLVKLSQRDNKDISIKANNDTLVDLLNNLGLNQMFKIS